MVLVVHLDEIKEGGQTLECQEKAEAFPALLELADAGECVFESPVSVALRVQMVGGMVEVSGQVGALIGLTCGRCLTEYTVEVKAPVELTLVRELPHLEQDEEGDFELTAEDMGLVLCEEDEYDLHDAVAEDFIVAMPLRPLCRQDCKGLCPVCGEDLNAGSCDCRPENPMNKFAALKNFKVQK